MLSKHVLVGTIDSLTKPQLNNRITIFQRYPDLT